MIRINNAKNLLALEEYDFATKMKKDVTKPSNAISNLETIPKSNSNPCISIAS
jgi:hypothetical protein